MSDYIKREDAVRRIAVLMAAEAESDGCEDQPMDTYIEYALEDLADIPSADVAPVRHGRWSQDAIYYGEDGSPCIVDICTECGAYGYYADFNYCPNCGAKMDEENDND